MRSSNLESDNQPFFSLSNESNTSAAFFSADDNGIAGVATVAVAVTGVVSCFVSSCGTGDGLVSSSSFFSGVAPKWKLPLFNENALFVSAATSLVSCAGVPNKGLAIEEEVPAVLEKILKGLLSNPDAGDWARA